MLFKLPSYRCRLHQQLGLPLQQSFFVAACRYVSWTVIDRPAAAVSKTLTLSPYENTDTQNPSSRSNEASTGGQDAAGVSLGATPPGPPVL
jgi:hypothetical protein